MTRDIHGSHAQRRARWRRWSRRLAWATVGVALLNMALMWVLSRPFFLSYVGPGVPVVGVAASTALYVLALCVPLIQRSAVNDLRLPRLAGEPREAWVQPVERSSRLVNGVLKGLAGAAFLSLLVGIGMSQSHGRNLQSILVLLAVAMWAAAVVFGITRAARFAVHRFMASASTGGLIAILRWAPGADAPETRALAYTVLGAPGAARAALLPLTRAGRRRSVAAHARYLATLARHDPRAAARGFRDLHDASPDDPLGALGLADVLLSLGHPAPQASRHAADWSMNTLFGAPLHLYAEADIARSAALMGDTTQAVAMVDSLLDRLQSEPDRRRAALLHRLASALVTIDPERAATLRTRAADLDPHGDIGARARRDASPMPDWV